MKKYKWEFIGTREEFFENLSSKTYKWSILTSHWGEECFFRRGRGDRFQIVYHKPYIANSFARVLYCKISDDENIIVVSGMVRMHTLTILLMTLWHLAFLYFLILTTLAKEPIPALIIIGFSILGALPIFLLKGYSEKVINLMDELFDKSY